MNRVTASASERLLQCPGHARLPWVRTESEAAAEGTRLHAIMERATTTPSRKRTPRISGGPSGCAQAATT